MNKKNTGVEFEKLAESIFKKLIKNPNFEIVEHNVLLPGIDGNRQIDVLIRSEIAGIKINTIIECKDYNSKISVGKIDEFHSKLMDIKANKGVFISKKGFSSTAIKKAKRLDITLCTAHEALKPSWSIDFEIPLIIEQIKPINYEIRYKANMDKDDAVSDKGHIEINNINIQNAILENWGNKNINFKRKNGLQIIVLEGLIPPYYITISNKDKSKRLIENLKIYLDIEIRTFSIPISKIRNTQILNNLSEGKYNIFMDITSIFEISNNFTEIKFDKFYNKPSLKLDLFIAPSLVKVSSIEIKKLQNKSVHILKTPQTPKE